MVIEVAESSQAQNTGDCAMPPAFLMNGLGCNVAVSYSADKCVVDYELLCVGSVQIDLNITQGGPDGTVGTLHKYDPRSGCTMDLEVSIRPAPAPPATTADAGAK
jgi:hypothetical protein